MTKCPASGPLDAQPPVVADLIAVRQTERRRFSTHGSGARRRPRLVDPFDDSVSDDPHAFVGVYRPEFVERLLVSVAL